MKIIIYLYDGITMLDAIGPYEVLRNMTDAEVFFVAERIGEIKADSGFINVNVKHSIYEMKEADILVIPGSTIGFINEMKNEKILKWIKEVDKSTKWTTSVCSGSLLLASAGLLDGLKATSHWKPINLLSDYGAIPTRERVVEQGKYITAAGVSAGIDMALFLANKIVGEDEAKAIQLTIEYDPQPLFYSGNYSNADEKIIKIAEKKLSKAAKKALGILGLIKNSKNILKIMK
ncbi:MULTISPECIES: DJ-1/PfpI family protein [unclassified Bacillus (in: firmicutes)]|uniref:DJ-1/PfpI family protein n=1 Tax=unclassified Bacillus (in: firmicutes) TaxID=185979 RepID=UPI0008F02C7B|nr:MULTISPECIES: DJ-1/PfpI family protein [unclassified Bacillus (in: firmicutes)]SFB21756.1 DJ-1/PfpI family protein [Bacillus sp. UNCCL13]SFQ91023.1 DJ-1/PfpI family protein [Bacillus sp. cl95]